MSAKIERRLNLIKKDKYDHTALKHSKSVSNISERQNTDFWSITDCKYETLGSSVDADINNSRKKLRKKKIRSTQDFNRLDSSCTSQDSEESQKGKTKKTKKSRKVYNLPRISQVAEDFSTNPRSIFSDDELLKKKKTKRKPIKFIHGKAPEDSHYEDRSDNEYKYKQDKVDGSDKNLEVSSKLQYKENNEDLNNDEYQSASSVISNNPEDSDEEIEIKHKKKIKKNKHNRSNNINNSEGKKDTTERYAKRIKKLLSNRLIRNSKSTSTSNSSILLTPLSDKKLEQNTIINTKEVKCEVTPKIDRRTVCRDKQNETEIQSSSTRLSRRINSTPYPKMKMSNSPYVNLKENEQSGAIKRSRTMLSDNFLPEAESIKVKTKKSSGSSILTVNVSFDMNSSSDNVFYNTFEKECKDNQNTDSNQREDENDACFNSNLKLKSRKSVRFQSPKQNNRRETLILTKQTTEIIPIEPDKYDNEDTILAQSFSERQSSTTKRNSMFEITSPKVINQANSCQNVSQNEISIDNSLQKQSTPHKQCEANTSKQPKKIFRTESLSQMNSIRKSKNDKDNTTISNSIIDLTTPVPIKKIEAGVTYSSEKIDNNDSIDISLKFDRQSTFCKDEEEPKSIIEDNNVSFVPNLVRTATFTKDDETVKQSEDLPLDFNCPLSPLPLDTSASKIVDTSKVNKRKRWDKSRLSVSFLEDSFDIGNISAPWQENDSIKNLSNLEASPHKQSLGLKRSSNINDSVKYIRSAPSGSSTPYVKGKSNLLRQALLKDRQDMIMNESKNRTASNEKALPKVTRTKIPNFALIHQRAYDKLENIKEMSERKAARAKLLLSGHKPPSRNVPKSSSKRKELKFSPAPLKSSSNDSNNINRNNINRSLSKSSISVTKINNLSPSKSNKKVANKENGLRPIEKKKELLKAKSLIPKPKLHNTAVVEKKGFTRFGFKIGSEDVKKISKNEQVKAVATKSKIVKNTIEERRYAIQGVRSNRRFELLMKMRIK